DFLKTTTNPPYGGEVKYGDKAEHCWNGDPNLPNYLSRLHYNTLYLPKILERITKTAPAGADLTSWRYLGVPRSGFKGPVQPRFLPVKKKHQQNFFYRPSRGKEKKNSQAQY